MDGGTDIRLILASTSPRRREILSQIGLDFTVEAPEVLESDSGESPEAVALGNARIKAMAVLERQIALPAALPVTILVLAVDTIVVSDGIVLSKPRSLSEARSMLNRLSNKEHEVQSGLCLLTGEGRRAERLARTRVLFAPLGADEIEDYLARGEYADKAGAYGIQGSAALFVQKIEGCYFNVVGLPVRAFSEALGELEIPLKRLARHGGGHRG